MASSDLARVAVLAPVRGLFTYALPPALAPGAVTGRRVIVPFGARRLTGFIVDRASEPPAGVTPREVAELLDDGPFLPDALFRFLLWTADYYVHPPGEVLRAALPPAGARRPHGRREDEPVPASPSKTLTTEQAAAAAAIGAAVEARRFQPFLLHGVTGSGKTEVYLHAIERTLATGRGAVVLVPEIGLTPQLVRRFRERIGEQIAVLHSGTSRGERAREWQRLRRGDARVAIGVRTAVFAPVDSLGLVVVDEEHDPSFKQEERLCYHARDMAVARAKLAACPVVLGSATPSLESLANAAAGRYLRLDLPRRVGDRPLPAVEILDLRGVDRPILHEPLLLALGETLARGEQAILFLNRRGHSGSLCCPACGHVEKCVQCSVSLTQHLARRRLVCHYCGASRPIPERCPVCGAEPVPVGAGTEKVEEEVARLFPAARVARLDGDLTRTALARTLRAFHDRRLDVLVGTQIVAKGHDFPGVTLVGVVLADTGLNLPDFRASERSFQVLLQVAGRAGRGERSGRVLVQTYHPDHPALVHLIRHDYASFAAGEMNRRKAIGWPPFSRLCAVRVDAKNPGAAERAARQLSRLAEDRIRQTGARASVLGPSLAPLERIKGRTRWHLLLRARSYATLRDLTLTLQQAADLGPVRVVFDVDPLSMM